MTMTDTTDEHYDAIVIGTSQGGRFLPVELAKAGQKVALVERGRLGGVCVNTGCTPTKTMVASARLAYQARRGAEFGVRTGPVSVDLAAVRERKRAMVAGARENYASRLAQDGLELIEGEARFTGPKTVEIALTGGGTRRISAPTVVIDTGTRAKPLEIPGADDVPVLDSTSIMELDELPEHLIILGGGYIGLEFAQMFRRFGSQVTIVERAERLAAREDHEISEAITDILREDGIEIFLNAIVKRVDSEEYGGVRVEMTAPDGDHELRGSHLLVAAGRVPNTEILNLDAAGVQTDQHGFIMVNECLQTTAPHIYAAGDVAGQPQFTHISYDDFRVLRDNLIDGKEHSIRGRLVPYTVFIDPQLGRVGMTEEQARKAGRSIKVVSIPMTSVARALEMDESRGLIRSVVDADTGEILGVSVLGLEGGEIMAMFEIAMMGKVPYTVLRDGIFAHPTLAELMSTLFSEI
jgi:pyruvate/2-oxoglutarate dehydrogenase complex dihydrolipoamide dehydrogenase (E3) component